MQLNVVALRKESVDRNNDTSKKINPVALRKESVDRNWISVSIIHPPQVALRKESVDRNKTIMNNVIFVPRRSPQGERG